MLEGKVCQDKQQWDDIVHDLGGHPLQLWGWGEVKSRHGWQARRVVFSDPKGQVIGAAQILIRKLPRPFKQFCYVPRGPVAEPDRAGEVIESLASYAKANLPGVALTIEPESEDQEISSPWQKSPNRILLADTIILDLDKSEADLLAAISKSTRYYIRKSPRDGIEVRQATTQKDLYDCLDIYHQTASRDKFDLHSDSYYLDIFHEMGESSKIFIAYKDDQPLSFVWLAVSSQTAFELYAGMNEQGRKLRVNSYLKWQAITTCKRWGVRYYDLNGLLEGGVSEFKRSFAKHDNHLIGPFDLPLGPLYKVWTKGLPTLKKAFRVIRR